MKAASLTFGKLLMLTMVSLTMMVSSPAQSQQVKVQIQEEKTVEGAQVESTGGPVDPQVVINPSFPGSMSYGLSAGQARLTFSSGSARTMLSIDGQLTFPGVQQMPLPPDKKGKPRTGVQSTYTHQNKVVVTQIMEVVPGKVSDKVKPGTPRKMNALLVRYLVENKDTVAHNVGVRMRIDTYCGNNDGCLFASPKTHKDQILNGIELKGKQVPDFLMILENPDLKNPGFTGHFTFRMGNKYEPPTRVALTSHGAKATSRAAANTSPEPVSNWTLSVLEDGLAVFLTWMAATHPVITGLIVVGLVILAVMVIWKLYGYFKVIRDRLRGRPV